MGNASASRSNGWVDNYGRNLWETYRVVVVNKDSNIWNVLLKVAQNEDGTKMLYDIAVNKKIGQAVKSARSLYDNIYHR